MTTIEEREAKARQFVARHEVDGDILETLADRMMALADLLTGNPQNCEQVAELCRQHSYVLAECDRRYLLTPRYPSGDESK